MRLKKISFRTSSRFFGLFESEEIAFQIIAETKRDRKELAEILKYRDYLEFGYLEWGGDINSPDFVEIPQYTTRRF